MFKISFCVRRNPDVSEEEFKRYWLGEHADLTMAFVEKLGVHQVMKCEALPDHPVGQALMEAYGTNDDLYDFVDHWVFNDIEELKEGSENPEVKAALKAMFVSEDRYLSPSRCKVTMSHDVAQFYPREEVRATQDTDFVKLYYVGRTHPGISRAQGQLHWNSSHGAVSRQDIALSQCTKYVQAHTIESTFVNNIVAERGYEQDPEGIGHAELWVNTVESPADPDADPEVAAEVDAMSMQDIDLFIDKNNSQCFVTKDHYLLDKRIITRTKDGGMPKFLSAVY